MTDMALLDAVSAALRLAIYLSLPFAVIGLVVGVLAGIFQAGTSIQDQSIGTVPRLVAVGVAVILLGPWVMRAVAGLAEAMLSDFSAVLG